MSIKFEVFHLAPKKYITDQCTNALLLYMRSNLRSSRAQASEMAVVLDSMHTALDTFARSPPGTTVGGWKFMPTCNQKSN